MRVLTLIVATCLLALTIAEPAPKPSPAAEANPKAKPAAGYGLYGYDSNESLESGEYFGNHKLYGGLGNKFGTLKNFGNRGFGGAYFGGLGGVPYGNIGGVAPSHFGTYSYTGHVVQPGIYGGLGTGFGHGGGYGRNFGITGIKGFGDFSGERGIYTGGFGGHRFGGGGFGGKRPFHYGRYR